MEKKKENKKKNLFHIYSIHITLEVFLRKYVLALNYFNGIKVCLVQTNNQYLDVSFVLKALLRMFRDQHKEL